MNKKLTPLSLNLFGIIYKNYNTQVEEFDNLRVK
jgi:hypothetical protein